MKRLAALLLVLAYTSWDSTASAHAILCRDSITLQDTLVLKHGEVVMYNAVTSGGILEVYINLDTGKWSLVLKQTNGVSCLLGYGENWRGPFILKEEEQHVTR